MRSEQQQLPDQATSTPLLTLSDVASLLGVSKAWVRDHATRRNPRIPVVRFGGRRAVLRFRRQDVDQFIAEHLISTEERGYSGRDSQIVEEANAYSSSGWLG
jgi:excisionase family DNA binding protein